jgi:hypothetical protein
MTQWEYATVPLIVHATKQILDNWGPTGGSSSRWSRAGRAEPRGLPQAAQAGSRLTM